MEEAAGLFRAAIARNQLDPQLHWGLAGVEEKLGDLSAARTAYAAAIEVAPLAAPGYLIAAAFEVQSGHDPLGAIAVLDRGIARIKLAPPRGDNSALKVLTDAKMRLEAGDAQP